MGFMKYSRLEHSWVFSFRLKCTTCKNFNVSIIYINEDSWKSSFLVYYAVHLLLVVYLINSHIKWTWCVNNHFQTEAVAPVIPHPEHIRYGFFLKSNLKAFTWKYKIGISLFSFEVCLQEISTFINKPH